MSATGENGSVARNRFDAEPSDRNTTAKFLRTRVDTENLDDCVAHDALTSLRVYSRPLQGRAGCARVSLSGDLSVNFDIEHHGEVIELLLSDEVDPLHLCAVLGVEAARACADRAETIQIPGILPRDGRIAATVAVLDRVLAIPLRSDAKCNLTTKLICAAADLADAGFDMTDLLSHHLLKFPKMFRPGCSEATRWAREDERLATAIAAGVEHLDPLDDEWQWFNSILEQLPDERLKLVEHLLETSPTHHAMLGTFYEHVSSEHAHILLPPKGTDMTDDVGLYARSEYAMRGATKMMEPSWNRLARCSWTFPLYWRLLDERICPPENGFDSAVRLSRDNSRSRVGTIHVQYPSDQQLQTELHARITADGNIINDAILSPREFGWSGRIVLPADFDLAEHHIEVASSPSYELIADHTNEERRQWALLARAQDLADLNSRQAWSKVEELTS